MFTEQTVQFTRSRRFCATIITLAPFIVLISNATVDGSLNLRASPYNTSYELMTCAVGSAVSVAAFLEPRISHAQTIATVPVNNSLRTNGAPFMLFMVFWSCVQFILNAVNKTAAAAVVWAIAALCSLYVHVHEIEAVWSTGTRSIIQLCFPYVTFSKPIDKNKFAIAMRAILIIFAILLWIPIVMPWEGPPEAFVRWHTFSIQGELLWRGTFACFSICNLLTAVDPGGAGASYVAFMAAQGFFHGTVMLVDNRVSASQGGPNGNPEHAWGEIPFFLLLGLSLTCLLFSRLRSEAFGLLPQMDGKNSVIAPSAAEVSGKSGSNLNTDEAV